MRFKYGSAIVTSKKNKEGIVIQSVVFKVGGQKFDICKFDFDKDLDKLFSKLEVKAKKIFAKNAKNKKQQGGSKRG